MHQSSRPRPVPQRRGSWIKQPQTLPKERRSPWASGSRVSRRGPGTQGGGPSGQCGAWGRAA